MELTTEQEQAIISSSRAIAAKHLNGEYYWQEFDDMVQAMSEAALIAAPRWDPKKGKFSTFISRRMQGALKDYFRDIDYLSRDHRKKVKAGKLENPGAPTSYSSLTDSYVRAAEEYTYDQIEEKEFVKNILETLPDIEGYPNQKKMFLHWLRDNGKTAQKRIGEMYGYSETRTAQIIKKYLNKAAEFAETDG